MKENKGRLRATWHVYILCCSDGSLYTGLTNDLGSRLDAHNAGKGAKYTATRRPVSMVYQEPAESKSAALKREIQIKRWSKRRKEALIQSKAVEMSTSKGSHLE